jgi:hypothetical protein
MTLPLPTDELHTDTRVTAPNPRMKLTDGDSGAKTESVANPGVGSGV